MKPTDCEQVLKILEDGKPHRNFDIIEIFGGGFALAARINDLKNQGCNIKSGPPKKFGKKRISKGDWYYQLKKSELKQQTFLKDIFVPLAAATIQADRDKLNKIFT